MKRCTLGNRLENICPPKASKLDNFEKKLERGQMCPGAYNKTGINSVPLTIALLNVLFNGSCCCCENCAGESWIQHERFESDGHVVTWDDHVRSY